MQQLGEQPAGAQDCEHGAGHFNGRCGAGLTETDNLQIFTNYLQIECMVCRVFLYLLLDEERIVLSWIKLNSCRAIALSFVVDCMYTAQ